MINKEVKVDWEKYPECIAGHGQSFDDGQLGGCNIYGDPALELPKTWKYIVDTLKVKNVVDVGCGFGFHSKYFSEILGLETLSIEGSEKIVELSVVPGLIKHHDYRTGPCTLDKTYDLCWSVEFVEHVEEKFVENFISTFKCCRYLLMTHALPGQGGHHHVNEKNQDYWINLLKSHNFEFDLEMTENCRKIASEDREDYLRWRSSSNEEKIKNYRGPAANSHIRFGEEYLEFFFEKNGLFFRNLNV